MDPIIAKRLVFHIGGYDPLTPEAAHRRFVRGLGEFEKTWSTRASASGAETGPDAATWRVTASGPNWRVETDYRLVRWDDVMEAASRRPMWRRLPLGWLAFLDFVSAGALWGYLRTNWRYAAFFLYPFLLFALLATLAALAGAFAAALASSIVAGAIVGAVLFAVLVHWPGRRFYLSHLFDDWIFSRDYVRRGDRVLDRRIEAMAREIVTAWRSRRADEIVVVGHSLGAVLAIDLLDCALRLEPALGRAEPRLAFLSIGSSILKIGLHRGADRFRAAVARVASATGLYWAEYQALTDVMNFYKSDPLAAMGLDPAGGPVVRIVRFRKMLEPAAYRRIRRNFFRMHCQFVRANHRREAYDYFMLLCGPLPVERQVRSPDGAVSAIGSDGTLLVPAAEGVSVRERPAKVAPG